MPSRSFLPVAAALFLASPAPVQRFREYARDFDPSLPSLVAWQRSLDDAEALARASGRPLLVCVNMDGEPASEQFAHVKYKDPEFAALVAAYVPVIVSPDRHAERDHDEAGRRVPCPRFGSVTCGEHVSMEPLAFERYFRGERVAPRHVGVFPPGEFLFDRYLDQDLRVVDEALRAHAPAPDEVALRALLASRDARDRARAESLYLEGDAEERALLLRLAGSSAAEPFELLRLGVRDGSPELRALALDSLAEVATPRALELVLELVGSEAAGPARDALVAALESLAATDATARRALSVLRGMALTPSALDVAAWRAALATSRRADPTAREAAPSGGDVHELYERIDALGALLAERPGDAELLTELAEASLDCARALLAARQNPGFFLEDARSFAARAGGVARPRAAAVAAEATWLLGDPAEAAALAERALAGLLAEADSPRAAAVLEVLARARTAMIYAAEREQDPWLPEWLAEAHAAFALLAQHPHGAAGQALAHVELLDYLGESRRAAEALDRALARSPGEGDLHQIFRARVERMRGLRALLDAYEELREYAPEQPALAWYAGYAGLVQAEEHVRAREHGLAREAYRRAILLLGESAALEPDWADSAAHYAALALASDAASALRQGELEPAALGILAAIVRRPESAEWPDGLGRTPLSILRDLRRALGSERAELEQRLSAGVRAVAPELWEQSTPAQRQ